MKVIVCGGPTYDDWTLLRDTLDRLNKERGPITHIIHGGAYGADSLAGDYADLRKIQTVECKANWANMSRLAGPYRNKAMLALGPDLVVAFPGGSGTRNMVELARDAGVEVLEIEVPPETPA